MGVALRDQGKLDEAIVSYRRALELKPDLAGTHHNLGGVLLKQGKLDEAVACFRRALELNPGFAETHSDLAHALMRQGKASEALAAGRRAMQLKLDTPTAHNIVGVSLAGPGMLRAAVPPAAGRWNETPTLSRRTSTLASRCETRGNRRRRSCVTGGHWN